MEVVLTSCPASGLAGGIDRRHEQGDENSDNGNHNQKFHERETAGGINSVLPGIPRNGKHANASSVLESRIETALLGLPTAGHLNASYQFFLALATKGFGQFPGRNPPQARRISGKSAA